MIKSLKFRRGITDCFIYILLIVLSLIWIAPILWLVLQSFSGEGIGASRKFLPDSWTINNYLYLWPSVTGLTHNYGPAHDLDNKFFTWFGNTIIVAVLTCIISTMFVLFTSYALSRFRFKGRKIFMKMNLIIGMFPGFLSMIIMYWVMKEIFHLQGSYW